MSPYLEIDFDFEDLYLDAPQPPQTIRETMDDIDTKLKDSINDFFKQNPNAMLKDCAEALGCDLELVWDVRSAIVGRPDRKDMVTVLDDLRPSSITDGLVVQPDTGCGSAKAIPTLAGAGTVDGKVVLPVLHDIVNERDQAIKDKMGHEERMQLQTASPYTREAWDKMLVAAGGTPSSDTAWERHHRSALEHDAVEERIEGEELMYEEEEEISNSLFQLAALLQLLATNYDYGSEEEYLEAQEFIMRHRRALKFLAIQADQIDGIIEEEELEEAENE